jgi:hypothetical protein
MWKVGMRGLDEKGNAWRLTTPKTKWVPEGEHTQKEPQGEITPDMADFATELLWERGNVLYF